MISLREKIDKLFCDAAANEEAARLIYQHHRETLDFWKEITEDWEDDTVKTANAHF
jgi:hypothetical protein